MPIDIEIPDHAEKTRESKKKEKKKKIPLIIVD